MEAAEDNGPSVGEGDLSRPLAPWPHLQKSTPTFLSFTVVA